MDKEQLISAICENYNYDVNARLSRKAVAAGTFISGKRIDADTFKKLQEITNTERSEIVRSVRKHDVSSNYNRVAKPIYDIASEYRKTLQNGEVRKYKRHPNQIQIKALKENIFDSEYYGLNTAYIASRTRAVISTLNQIYGKEIYKPMPESELKDELRKLSKEDLQRMLCALTNYEDENNYENECQLIPYENIILLKKILKCGTRNEIAEDLFNIMVITEFLLNYKSEIKCQELLEALKKRRRLSNLLDSTVAITEITFQTSDEESEDTESIEELIEKYDVPLYLAEDYGKITPEIWDITRYTLRSFTHPLGVSASKLFDRFSDPEFVNRIKEHSDKSQRRNKA